MEQDLKNCCANNKISRLATYPVEPQLPLSFLSICVLDCPFVPGTATVFSHPPCPSSAGGAHPPTLLTCPALPSGCGARHVGLTVEEQPGCPLARRLPGVHQESRSHTCCSRRLSPRMRGTWRGANLGLVRPTAWAQPSWEAWRIQGHRPSPRPVNKKHTLWGSQPRRVQGCLLLWGKLTDIFLYLDCEKILSPCLDHGLTVQISIKQGRFANTERHLPSAVAWNMVFENVCYYMFFHNFTCMYTYLNA